MLINSLSINIASKSSFTLENWLKSKSQELYKELISIVNRKSVEKVHFFATFCRKNSQKTQKIRLYNNILIWNNIPVFRVIH